MKPPVLADAPTRAGRPWHLLPPMGVFLFAFLLRLFRIGQESFFIDEGLSLHAINTGILAHVMEREGTPPLFFFALKWWGAVFGMSHESLRSLSALTGAAAAALLVIAARRWGMGWIAAVGAGVALAVSPQAVWYGQQVRAYAMTTMWVAAWLALVAPVVGGGWRRALSLALVIALGFATHFYFGMVVAGGVSWLVLMWWMKRGDRDVFRPLIVGNLVAVVLCLPTLWFAWYQFSHGVVSWMPKPTWMDLRDIWVRHYLLGNAARPSPWIAWGGVALFAALAAGASWHSIKGLKGKELATPANAFAVSAGAISLAVIFPFLYSRLSSHSVFMAYRYSVIGLPVFFFGLAAAISSIGSRWAQAGSAAAAGVLVLGCAIAGLIPTYRDYQDFDWRGAIKIVESDWQPDDRMLFLPGWQRITWLSNGGKDLPRAEDPRHTHGTLWMLTWTGNGNAKERALADELAKRPDSRIRMGFPHIQLVEIQRTDSQ